MWLFCISEIFHYLMSCVGHTFLVFMGTASCSKNQCFAPVSVQTSHQYCSHACHVTSKHHILPSNSFAQNTFALVCSTSAMMTCIFMSCFMYSDTEAGTSKDKITMHLTGARTCTQWTGLSNPSPR